MCSMNIAITKPELEARIQRQLREGAFKNPEEVTLNFYRYSKPRHPPVN